MRKLKIIYFQSQFINCLVNDQLDIKMVENNMYKPILQKFDPNTVIQMVMEMFKD